MKHSRIFLVMALVLLVVITAVAQEKQQPPRGTAPSQTGPVLVIDSFTHDFGEVKSGTPLRYAFKIKNEGKSDLLIDNVSPG